MVTAAVTGGPFGHLGEGLGSLRVDETYLASKGSSVYHVRETGECTFEELQKKGAQYELLHAWAKDNTRVRKDSKVKTCKIRNKGVAFLYNEKYYILRRNKTIHEVSLGMITVVKWEK